MTSVLQKLRSMVPWGADDRFAKLCKTYMARVKEWKIAPSQSREDAPHFAILVTPWLGTAVPLFSIECALALAQAGRRVTVIWDRTDVVGNAPDDHHVERIAKLLEAIRPMISVMDANSLFAKEGDYQAADQILQSNAIWRMRGEDKADNFHSQQPGARERIAKRLGAIEDFLKTSGFDFLFLPGGIFGLSGVYVAAANKIGMRFSTFDSGVGVLRLAHDSIAAHLGDLPVTYSELQPEWRRDPTVAARVTEIARGEIGDRAAAKDFRQFQVAAASERDDLHYDIVVPLNIRWDSAALLRQRLFDSVNAWLRAVLQWVVEHPHVSICIRQHPRERLDFAKGSDTLAPLLQEFSSLGDRLRFVECTEALNTYDLLRNARVVLPHTSTVGIEAAMLGKAVVLGTHSYYEDFGFCYMAATKDEYFDLIARGIAGQLPADPAKVEDAGLAYYLTQRCALLRTPFTADPRDAEKWMAQAPNELWSLPELKDFCEALLTHRPLSLIRHRRIQNAN